MATWVESKNQITRAYLAELPARDVFKTRLKQLSDFERFTVPVSKGGRTFYFHNSGVQNQRVLYVRDTVDGAGRVLIDPNTWAADGADALAEWAASNDGRYVAYAVQVSGADARTIRVLNVDKAAVLPDEIKWAKFTTIVWAPAAGKSPPGFFYTRFPDPVTETETELKEGAAAQAKMQNHAVYFHVLGTPQAKDRLVFSTPEDPVLMHSLTSTADGRYLAINSMRATTGSKLTIIDTQSVGYKPIALIDNFDDQWGIVGNTGIKLFLMTSKDAPRYKVLTVDIATANLNMTALLLEQDALMNGASLVGGRLMVMYLVDMKTEVRRYSLEGKPDGVVKLPGIGTAIGFDGTLDSSETFYGFASFNALGVIYRYDVASNTARVWSAAKVAIDLTQIAVEQRFYKSNDGTRVPMLLVRRKDVTGPAPTLLYAYGGYGLIDPPGFAPAMLAWVEQGSVFAVAYVRGGGEYGRAWHEAGRRLNKQNVFDDFIAAGEYLKAQGIATRNGLAVHGASNGGLLMGAVVNQRPDLFAAALVQVGVLDMLRFDKFTAGKLWVDEYGDPAKEANFHNLYKYSPYHHIQSDQLYPATLASTADTDDRVVPGHTFKYVAALQAADIGDKPHLARIETRAGHGSGKPTDKVIEETADMFAFAAR